jgi:hypothetical protein
MKPKIFIEGSRGNWRTRFTIGVQTFTVCQERTKKEALWYCKMLKIAFKNLKS